jgi:hypothetical protein
LFNSWPVWGGKTELLTTDRHLLSLIMNKTADKRNRMEACFIESLLSVIISENKWLTMVFLGDMEIT